MESRDRSSRQLTRVPCYSNVERRDAPSVIVIGGGFAGVAAARALHDASFQVVLLESRDRLGGRVYTDYSFGFPVDMGASWLHGVCKENPLAPLIGRLGLPLYRTSGDNSVLYDHDLESYALFDMDGNQVPQDLVTQVGKAFENILNETDKVRQEYSEDMSVMQAVSIVLERHPDLRPEGLSYNVLQWYLCRMEGWFAADADTISLKCWDQEELLPGGHGLMVRGYLPVINTLSKGLDIRLSHRVTKVARRYDGVKVTVEDGRTFVADAAIVAVPLGVLKAPELFVNLPTGVRLCYQTFGDPADPAVLLIAGHSGSMLEWQEEMLRFFSPDGDRHFIIRFDHRDTGLSTEFPVPGGYTLMHMVMDVEGLIDHLGLPAKGLHLVGASMGGAIAYMLAARRPQQLRSLTLVYASPGASEELPLNPEYEVVNSKVTPVDIGGGKEAHIKFTLQLYEALATQPLDDYEKERIKTLVTRVADRDMRGGTLHSKGPNHGAAAFSDRPGVEVLNKITCPAAVVQAAKDQIFGVIHGEALAKGIPGAEYVLFEDVGHELPRRIWGRLGEVFLQTWKRGDAEWAKES